MREVESEIGSALLSKLHEVCERFADASVRRLDVGIFPWHGTVEISLLLNIDSCPPQDIAGWPNYNVTGLHGGKDGLAACDAMMELWNEDPSTSNLYFQFMGKLLRGPAAAGLFRRLNPSMIEITVLDPDDAQSINFAATSP